MPSAFEGFEGYLTPNDEEYKSVIGSGVVAIDANVLLSLYRYNTETRARLIQLFGELGESLFVPHQAMKEFWRNRESALADPAARAGETLEALGLSSETSSKAIREWANRVALEAATRDRLLKLLDDAFDSVAQEVEHIVAELSLDAKDARSDPVVESLSTALVDRVGPPFTEEELPVLRAEAAKRIEAQIPPGYKDQSKGAEGAFGDFFVWEQAVRAACDRDVDLLIITNDVKEDWWRIVRGESRGPRVELVEEFRRRTGRRLFMMRPESILRLASTVLGADISPSVVEEAERVDRTFVAAQEGDWSEEATKTLLEKLLNVGDAQRAAIVSASSGSGFVSRDEVYQLAGYDPSRTLRGFTRPTSRIAQSLRDRGILSGSAPDPLITVYDPDVSYVVANGFRVPDDLSRHVRRILGEPSH